MTSSCLSCRKSTESLQQQQMSEPQRQRQQQQQVIVETVTDDEETGDLLPPTADTVESARLPCQRAVIYMFPRAWMERTRSKEEQEDVPAESSSYYSSYCTIS
mmetsp:Transcript_19366/g.48216  ORF Transcript_19366/g.48216 Transcript_19366/m.48216 type:complete len:103 (-) Transcript_19366:416-724(-)|eukprot:CAMPEP_0116087590 /NCGR_PEP_ID=MMETSP0327-20121206/5441_1 /TAXON_ID=44447 /ORGANISM="Pseudo-nitzschia delicatissima, Strain B596" /LENGTH=102 /DNA_ID=CAMNT_0003578661 /DNA_START=1050 /DNA_END=1358 /DNA_ORIENTATION=-